MNGLTFQLLRLMLNPRITAKPLWALAKLRAQGIRRVPDRVYTSLRPRRRKGAALDFIRQWLDGERLTRHQGRWVLNSFIPPFPGPGYDRMFDNLFSGRHLSPVSAFLAVTAQCPCRCFHCSAAGRADTELTAAEWLDVLWQLLNLGVSIIGFTGGEPLLRGDLPELVRHARRLGLESILFTAGAGVTPAKMAALKKAGLWACCVSLDFDNAADHDRMRGIPGIFAQALETIRISKSHGFYTMVSSVATRDFVENAWYARVHELGRKLGIHEYRIVELMPCGKLAQAGAEIFLTARQIARLRDFHVQTNRRGIPPKICAFNQIESPEIFGCGAGTQHLYIQPNGVVCPCDFTPLGFGNVRDTALDSIWRRMNKALGDNPRRDCFIRKYHRLIAGYRPDNLPLPPELSETVCAQTAPEPLPAYFAMVNGQPSPGET